MRGSVKMGVKAAEIDANNRCERGMVMHSGAVVLLKLFG